MIHANYNNPKKVSNDIALLYLERPIAYDNFVRAVKLPEANKWPAYPDACIVTGFGRLTGLDTNMGNGIAEVSFFGGV